MPAQDLPENLLQPLHAFRFHVSFSNAQGGDAVDVCSGAFAECTGLEATMDWYRGHLGSR